MEDAKNGDDAAEGDEDSTKKRKVCLIVIFFPCSTDMSVMLPPATRL